MTIVSVEFPKPAWQRKHLRGPSTPPRLAPLASVFAQDDRETASTRFEILVTIGMPRYARDFRNQLQKILFQLLSISSRLRVVLAKENLR